jgi:Lhr-like helicase
LTYQEAKTSALSTIHSVVFQLAGRDEELKGIVCESTTEDLKSDLTAAGDLLSSLIRYSGPVYLVIDGVDEISKAERGRLLIELLRLTKICEKLRIILSSRPEADLMRILGEAAVVIQIHDHNEGSIKEYVLERTQYIFNSRRVFPKAQIEIRKLLAPLPSRAKGMFLYARLIMDMVATMHDLSEMQKEFAVLPENLDAA